MTKNTYYAEYAKGSKRKSHDFLRKVTIFYENSRLLCSRRSGGGPGTVTPFDGEAPSTPPRGDLPPRVFLPRSYSSDPPGRGRKATPRRQQQQQQQHDGVVQGSRAIIAPRELWLILSGIPLSLTTEMLIFDIFFCEKYFIKN